MSVNGTDFFIRGPSPFSTRWWSHKCNGPAVRYEITVSINPALMVCADGPWPAGCHSDIRVLRNGLRGRLQSGEFVIGDSGYTDTRCFPHPGPAHPLSEKLSLTRARHEMVNKRLKKFNVLSHRFCHNLEMHGDCFFAVANLTQLLLLYEPLFHLEV